MKELESNTFAGGNYAYLSNKIARCGKFLTPSEKTLLIAINSWRNNNDNDNPDATIWVYKATLSKGQKDGLDPFDSGSGIDERQQRRIIQQLVKKGILEIISGERESCFRCRINYHAFPSRADTEDRRPDTEDRHLGPIRRTRKTGERTRKTGERTPVPSEKPAQRNPHRETLSEKPAQLRLASLETETTSTHPTLNAGVASAGGVAGPENAERGCGEGDGYADDAAMPEWASGTTTPTKPSKPQDSQRDAQEVPASATLPTSQALATEDKPTLPSEVGADTRDHMHITNHQRSLAQTLLTKLTSAGYKPAPLNNIVQALAVGVENGVQLKPVVIDKLAKLKNKGLSVLDLFMQHTDASGKVMPYWRKLLGDNDHQMYGLDSAYRVIELWEDAGLNGLHNPDRVARRITQAVKELKYQYGDALEDLLKEAFKNRSSKDFRLTGERARTLEWLFEIKDIDGQPRYNVERLASGVFNWKDNKSVPAITTTNITEQEADGLEPIGGKDISIKEL